MQTIDHGGDKHLHGLDGFNDKTMHTLPDAITADRNFERNKRNSLNNFDGNATSMNARKAINASAIGHSPMLKLKTNQCDSIERNTKLLAENIAAINYNCNDDNIMDSQRDSSVISSNYSDNWTDVNTRDRKAGGYLIAVHRKLSRQDTYFLTFHKTRPSLFGVPLLIPCYEDGTNKDLYCAVWIQVARLLSPLPATPPDQSNHATDW